MTQVWINGQGDYSELHLRPDGTALRANPENGGQIRIDGDLSPEEIKQLIADEGMSLDTDRSQE
ncbi:hypothetical protein [Amycolatopsis sp. 195334CR]|uniref:hypothetical protein n=1 Tax=Amycolatopsis sp. 195334CR TaxID=2814588 RepID=UPI001A8D03A5|nr:hypothetical protein [Amycolatopsis sp. 195334CR]MBN6037461.1 hypothetical protein [Amycolatopsis sp. 195334CR]